MAEDLTVKILDVANTPTVNSQGRFIAGLTLTFNVGLHGPYSITLPQDGYTADAAKKAVMARADEIKKTLA